MNILGTIHLKTSKNYKKGDLGLSTLYIDKTSLEVGLNEYVMDLETQKQIYDAAFNSDE